MRFAMKWILLIMLPAMNSQAASSLASGVSCGSNSITWDGSLYTCTGSTVGWASAVSPGAVDFSTITTALGGKLSTTGSISTSLIDLSTVTTALNAKLSTTAGISPGLIDLSTVTIAVATKQNTITSAMTLSVGTTTMSGALTLQSLTKVQLVAITPTAKGQEYFCTDCVPPKDVVSTGTSKANFADTTGGTFK